MCLVNLDGQKVTKGGPHKRELKKFYPKLALMGVLPYIYVGKCSYESKGDPLDPYPIA